MHKSSLEMVFHGDMVLRWCFTGIIVAHVALAKYA